MRGKSSSKNNQNHFVVAKLTPLKEATVLQEHLAAKGKHIAFLREKYIEEIAGLRNCATFGNPVATKDLIGLLEKLPVESDFQTNFRKIVFSELPEKTKKMVRDFITTFYSVPFEKLFEIQNFETFAVAKANLRRKQSRRKR